MKTGCRVDEKLPLTIEIERRSFFPMGALHLHVKIKNILFHTDKRDFITAGREEKNAV